MSTETTLMSTSCIVFQLCMVTLGYAKITLYMKLQLYVCICLDLQHLAGYNHM